MLAHRVRVHDALKETALAADGVGPPCNLHLSSPVSDVDPETATIILKDGTKMTGDVVIGADGVHSKSRRRLPGGEGAKPFPSGKSGFRFMIRRQDALDDPITRELCKKTGVFTVVVGSDRRIVMYPTSNNTLLNFLAIHPDSESQAGEDWNSGTSKSALLNVYKDWAPAFQAILDKADVESLKLWKLLDMENLPAWYTSRFALIGDAAHPFLPHQGQGAAIAMEDAVALGTVLERGLSPDEIPERLKLYNEIRYERACKVQQFTRVAGLDVQDGQLDSKFCDLFISTVVPRLLIRVAVEFSKYNFNHDEFDNSAQKLREWKWARLPKVAFRMPVAFGPDKSLCPSIAAIASWPTFHTTSIRFVTSRTLVKNFLPPGVAEFSFETPGTLATCSFVHTSFENVAWLHGGSRDILGLYIHNVIHKGSSGQQSRGAYVPVLFENLPDTVVRDREVYGLPAIHSEITADHHLTGCRVSVSSDGHEWITLNLDDLKPGPAPASMMSSSTLLRDEPADSGLLSWRSVPRFVAETGAENLADVDAFAVKVSFGDEDHELQVHQVFESSHASIRFDVHDRTNPYPLGIIIERLAEIPIYKIVNAKVIIGKGNPGFKLAYRI